jgi:hypothetical protein
MTNALKKVNDIKNEINALIEDSGAGFSKTQLSAEFKQKYGDNKPKSAIHRLTADQWARARGW